MKVAASNKNIKIHQLFFKQRILGVRVTSAQRKTSGRLNMNWLLNNDHDNDHKTNLDLLK